MYRAHIKQPQDRPKCCRVKHNESLTKSTTLNKIKTSSRVKKPGKNIL